VVENEGFNRKTSKNGVLVKKSQFDEIGCGAGNWLNQIRLLLRFAFALAFGEGIHLRRRFHALLAAQVRLSPKRRRFMGGESAPERGAASIVSSYLNHFRLAQSFQ
jgi:hypothetical protein